ncbi:MAG: UPF0175 family protein [Chloroflexi bacterium]|nr:UPF0175 family protein [Chloroflexota bacterium]
MRGAERCARDGRLLVRSPGVAKLLVEVPSDVADGLRIPPEEREGRVRRELAARLYQKGLLTLGKARALAGMSKWDFVTFLAEEGIVRQYDVEDLDADVRTLEGLP